MSNFVQKKRAPRALILAVLVVVTALLALGSRLLSQTTPSGLGEVKDAAKAYALLQALAKEAMLFDEDLGRTRVSIANGVVVYDFRPARHSSLVSHPDRLTTALEILIRAGALDRDFRLCLPAEIFWVAPLDHVRSLAEEVVNAAYSKTAEAEWQSAQQAYAAKVQAELASLEKDLLAYAKKAGFDVRGSRGTVEGYNTAVRIEPAGGRVRVMPFLTYRKCQVFKLNLDDYWLDLTAGSHPLIGKYHYLAEWPRSVSEPHEGNFEVEAEGATVTVSPLPKKD